MTAVGTLLGWIVGQAALWPLRPFLVAHPAWTFGVIGSAVGASVGFAQLRAGVSALRLPALHWIVANVTGWGLGIALFASGDMAPALRLAGIVVPGVATSLALGLSESNSR